MEQIVPQAHQGCGILYHVGLMISLDSLAHWPVRNECLGTVGIVGGAGESVQTLFVLTPVVPLL